MNKLRIALVALVMGGLLATVGSAQVPDRGIVADAGQIGQDEVRYLPVMPIDV